MNASSPQRLACRIAAYWLTCPLAGDTHSGVRRWWLDAPARERDVQQALEALVDAGIAQRVERSTPLERFMKPTYKLAVAPEVLRSWIDEHCRPRADS